MKLSLNSRSALGAAAETFFVNGNAVTGAFPVPLLAASIDQIVAHASGSKP